MSDKPVIYIHFQLAVEIDINLNNKCISWAPDISHMRFFLITPEAISGKLRCEKIKCNDAKYFETRAFKKFKKNILKLLTFIGEIVPLSIEIIDHLHFLQLRAVNED